jgi:hypothetical protein
LAGGILPGSSCPHEAVRLACPRPIQEQGQGEADGSGNEDSKVRDLEKRLAEALRDKAEAQVQLQTRDRELVEERDLRKATAEPPERRLH